MKILEETKVIYNYEGDVQSELHYDENGMYKLIRKEPNKTETFFYNEKGKVRKSIIEETEIHDDLEITNKIIKSIKSKDKVSIATTIVRYDENRNPLTYLVYKNGVNTRHVENKYNCLGQIVLKEADNYTSVFKYIPKGEDYITIINTKYDNGKMINKRIEKIDDRHELITKTVNGETTKILYSYDENGKLIMVTENDFVIEHRIYSGEEQLLFQVYDYKNNTITTKGYSSEGCLSSEVIFKIE